MKNGNPKQISASLNSLLLSSAVFLTGVCGCSQPPPSSSAENSSPGSALESLFTGSGEMEKTQAERKRQQEKMIEQQKELQKKRLESYDPDR